MSKIIETEELITTFVDKAKIEYPHISSSNIEKIVRAQFLQMKQTMQSGSLEEIRLKFLFTVRVSPQKIIKQLHVMHQYRERIRPEKFQHYLIMILNYINTKPIKFDKYETRIEKYTGFTPEQIRTKAYLNN